MKNEKIKKSKLVPAIYQKLKQLVPADDVRQLKFYCPIDSYYDTCESGHLTMICNDMVKIGNSWVFSGDEYKSKRYSKPILGYILALPIKEYPEPEDVKEYFFGKDCMEASICILRPFYEPSSKDIIFSSSFAHISPIAANNYAAFFPLSVKKPISNVSEITDYIDSNSEFKEEDVSVIAKLIIEACSK